MSQLELERTPEAAEKIVGSGRFRLGRVATTTSALPLLALAVMAALTRSSGIDDAYISYRYAKNLADGRGLVFNSGEHVEGISNLLWTLLLTPFSWVGLPLPVIGYLLGFASLAILAVLTRRLAAAMGLPPVVSVAIATAVALTSDLVAGATMGLEGGLYAALIVAALLAWADLPHRKAVFAFVVAGLAMTRPEGLVVASVIATTCLLKREQPVGVRIRAAASGLALIAVCEVCRWLYFGSFIPNSVTAKRDIGVPLWETLRRHAPAGFDYVWSGVGVPLLLCTLAASAATAVLVLRGSRPSLPAVLLPMLAVLVLGLSLPILSGGDWMPYARLLTPYLPVLYLLTACLLASIEGRRWLAVATLFPFVLAAVSPHDLPLRDGGRNPLTADAGFDSLGRAASRADLEGRTVATDVLGRFSFYAPHLRVEDLLGLTDPVVANTPGSGSVFGKHNYSQVASTRPAVVSSNYWPALRAYLGAASDQQYVAIVSRTLTYKRVFVLAEPGVAQRVAAALPDPDVHIVPVNSALADWRRTYPHGQ